MEFQVIKTTLANANGGICGSPNNASYKGKTSCYSIVRDDGVAMATVKRKKDAAHFCYFLNRKLEVSNWDGDTGDQMAAYQRYLISLYYLDELTEDELEDLQKIKEV